MSIRIKVRDFSFSYGESKALENINIDIYKNKVTALIGPSGCGKSTFLRSFNRMNDLISDIKYEGEIRLDGEQIFDNNYDLVELRKKIG
ncbi:MAG: ATP-binding cassette domain-containing protein, partial [Fusobacteriaceae bacterium]